jgi:DNA invertase Pin-like site-specific DNA recombinase
MLIGYGRVSTLAQDTALQEDAFARAGCERIVTEKWSSVGARPALARLLHDLRPGDCVVVYKLDRLGRSLQDLLSILQRISDAGAMFRSITEPIDTTNPAGKLMYSILGAVAEFERSLIRERSIAGQVAALRRGVRWGGRKASLGPRERREVVELVQRYGFTQEAVADAYGVSRATVHRALFPKPPEPRKRLPVLSKYLRQAHGG